MVYEGDETVENGRSLKDPGAKTFKNPTKSAHIKFQGPKTKKLKAF